MRRTPLLPLLALLATAACQDVAPAPEAPPPLSEDPAAMPELSVVAESQQSSWEEVLHLVIEDTTGWASAWEHLHDGVSPPPPLPAVDFGAERLLLVTAGARPTGGYALRPEGSTVRGDTLVVRVVLSVPGEGCATTQALTAPAIVLGIPSVPAAVTVERREEATPCGSP